MECLPCYKQYPVNYDVIEISPLEHHDFHGEECCSHTFSPENALRIKFLVLFLFKLPIFAPIQILYRLLDFVRGGFYHRGREAAGYVASTSSIIGHVLLELIKDVCRIVFYPLYFIAMECVAVIGWVCPILGMRMASRLDQLYYVHPSTAYIRACCLEQFGNLAVPCMQTKEFRKEMNLFRYASDYNPWENWRSIRLILEHRLKEASRYFTPEELKPIKDVIMLGRASIPQMQNATFYLNQAMRELPKGKSDALRLAHDALVSYP